MREYILEALALKEAAEEKVESEDTEMDQDTFQRGLEDKKGTLSTGKKFF